MKIISSNEELQDLIELCYEYPNSSHHLVNFDQAFQLHIIAILVSMVRDRSLAEDAYRSALVKFIRLFREGQRPVSKRAYVSYFVSIAKNCLVDELRQRQRTVPLDDLLAESNVPELQVTVDMDARIAVIKAMSLLERRCRYLLEGYYLVGFPIRDLALKLKIQENSAYVVLQRCRDELKKLLS